MKKTIATSAAVSSLAVTPAFAALDTTAIISEISGAATGVTAVMAAMIGLSVLFVAYRFVTKAFGGR
jgi:hypothetical protein